MPFTAEAYAEMPRLGMHPAGQPMRDRRGGVIFAYTPFTVERRELLQPFRHVDEIRILERRLRDWLSLSELQNQMVITRYFTAANFDDMKELHRTWSGMCAGFRLTERQMDSVRDYFGALEDGTQPPRPLALIRIGPHVRCIRIDFGSSRLGVWLRRARGCVLSRKRVPFVSTALCGEGFVLRLLRCRG